MFARHTVYWQFFFFGGGGVLPPEVCPSILCTPRVKWPLFIVLNFQETTYREHVYNSMYGYKVTPLPHFRWWIRKKKVLSYTQVNMVQFMFMVEPRNLQVAIVWVLALLFQGLFLYDLTFGCSWRSKSSRLFLLYFQLCCLLCHDKWVHHHGLVRPQVAGGGTTSIMEGSREYIE
jgi:hypothetical protein